MAKRPPEDEAQIASDYKMAADAVELLDPGLRQPQIQVGTTGPVVIGVTFGSSGEGKPLKQRIAAP